MNKKEIIAQYLAHKAKETFDKAEHNFIAGLGTDNISYEHFSETANGELEGYSDHLSALESIIDELIAILDAE